MSSLLLFDTYVCHKRDTFMRGTQMFTAKRTWRYVFSERVKTHVRTTNAKCAGTSYRVRELRNRNLCLNGEQTSQLVRHSCLANAIYMSHMTAMNEMSHNRICSVIFFYQLK